MKDYNNDSDAEDRVFINENLVYSLKKLLNAERDQVRAKCLAGVRTQNSQVTIKTVAESIITITSHPNLRALLAEAQLGGFHNDL